MWCGMILIYEHRLTAAASDFGDDNGHLRLLVLKKLGGAMQAAYSTTQISTHITTLYLLRRFLVWKRMSSEMVNSQS